MKVIVFLSLMLLSVSMFLCVPQTAAEYEPYTQLSLPEGAKARLGKGRLTGDIAYSPDGTRLAVASSIGIWMYDAQTGEALDLLTGHTGDVLSVSFSPDGTTLASGSRDRTIRLWNAETGEHLHTLIGHTDAVNSVSFSPDGNTITSGGDWDDTTIRLWNAETGEHLRTLKGHTSRVSSVSFSPDGTTIASGSWDNTIRLWDMVTGAHKQTFTGHTDGVNSVSFSPDGATITSGSGDDTVRLWDVATGTLKATLIRNEDMDRRDDWEQVPIRIQGVNSVVFSPDGTILVSGDHDHTVCLWDVATGILKSILTQHQDSVLSVSFSPDGTILASGGNDGIVKLQDVATGTLKTTLAGYKWDFGGVAFSPDGTTLASGSWAISSSDGMIHLWDVATDTLKITLTGHGEEEFPQFIDSIAFSSDGNTIAGVGGAVYHNRLHVGMLKLWDVATSTPKATLRGIANASSAQSFAFSPDGNLIAGGDDSTLCLWDVATGKRIATFTGHKQWVEFVAFSPDGGTLATGSSGNKDGTVYLWDIATGTLKTTLTEHQDVVNSVSFSPDGGTLATGSGSSKNTDTTVRLWDVATGTLKATLTEHESAVYRVVFSPDGHMIASGSADGTVHLWDVATGTLKATFMGSIRGDVYSPDGSTLAITGGGSTVRLWDVATDALKATFTGYTDGVNSVAFSPDGSTLASENGDSTILLWELPLISPEQEKDILVNFQLKNGKEVTLYRESKDTIVYTFGVPSEKPELEYKGPILAEVRGTSVLWSDGMENLTNIAAALAHPAEDSSWATVDGKRDIIAKNIAEIAKSRESRGFIRVSAITGLISESVYIFRTGGWEYIVAATASRPGDVSDDELDDYKSYGITVLSPKGKKHRLR